MDGVPDDGLVFLVDDDGGIGVGITTAQQHQQRPFLQPYQQQHLLQQPVASHGSLLLHASASHHFLQQPPFPDPRCPAVGHHHHGDLLAEAGPEIGPESAVSSFPAPELEQQQQLLPHSFRGAVPFPLSPGAAAGEAWSFQQSQGVVDRNVAIIEEFFVKNGAYRPAVPCDYCRRLRLQCLILQTTSANPNPLTSCSSCVALYRDCSLAERGKRKASAFETPLPVIGHLHGVSEEGDGVNGPQLPEDQQDSVTTTATAPGSSTLSCKRNSTRSVKKTRVLRNWFSSHLDHPYPCEEEKTVLADQSGLSKTQVINWFANARRRYRLSAQSYLNNNNRVFLQGSPMPQSALMGMSPMERWKHSPPDEEPVSASIIQQAASNQPDGDSSSQNLDSSSVNEPTSSASGDSGLYNPSLFQDASSNSASSSLSLHHSDDAALFPLSAQSSTHGDQEPGPFANTTISRAKSHTFQCTFCFQSFKKKYDWVRHERSIHLPGLDSWICRVPLPKDQSHLVWRMNHGEPECVFCGQTSPTDEHVQSHEFQSCAERPVSERTFTRKDHLWQHLHKFHRCRKWDGWKPNLQLLQHRQDKFEGQCGFCQISMHSWEERVQHLASHFRRGATMAEWLGGSGVKDRSGEGGMMSGDEASRSHSIYSPALSGGNLLWGWNSSV